VDETVGASSTLLLTHTLPDDFHLHAPAREQLVARSLHPLAHGSQVDIDQFSGHLRGMPAMNTVSTLPAWA
jgi:hypothetical protein